MDDLLAATDIERSTLHQAQRRRRGVQAALVKLETAIAAPSTGREQEWVARVADRLTGLSSTFGHHVEVTEGPAGLFEEVMSDAPRLSHQIDQLRVDHVRITAAIDRALILATRPGAGGHVSDLGEAVVDLLSRVTRHRHLGATLVYEAYSVDMDAAD